MKDETQISTHIIEDNNNNNNKNKEEEEEDSDGEFYEKIEAPKFVDFTVSDHFRPDDRYWFCLRVGCDQKHEEEMDSEAIYKDFILRVMAARSPNVRFRKASSSTLKCPLSAPPKPSKSRVSRLAVISSFSRKMVHDKGNAARPLTKISSTPKAKSKQVASKYLTTPRNKKCLPNQNSFRSVQNPKPTPNAVPKNRMIAKALVFSSPKKSISKKTSIELHTPITKICEGIKRLEITSQRKHILGYSNKSSKDNQCNIKKTLALDSSRNQQSAWKEKIRDKGFLNPQTSKDQKTKSLIRSRKSKSRGNITKQCLTISKEIGGNGNNGIKIDVKSRNGNASENSRFHEASGNFDSKNSIQEAALLSSKVPPSTENSDAALSDASKGEMTSVLNSEERDLESNNLPKFIALNGEVDDGSDIIALENNIKSGSVKQDGSTNDPKYQSLEGAEKENEEKDSVGKENAFAPDDNRDFNHENQQLGREILSRQETSEKKKKVAQTLDKNLKDGRSCAATGGLVKYRTPKPTSPKPFRLRTDERGILKEAYLERKTRIILAPRKEVATVARLKCGNSQKKPENGIKRNGKCSAESNCNNDLLEDREKESQKNLQKGELLQNDSTTAGIKTSRGKVKPKLAPLTPQRRFKSAHEELKSMISPLEYGKVYHSLRKTESPSMLRRLDRKEGSTRKAVSSCMMTPGQQLGGIRATSSKLLRVNEAGKPSESDATTSTKATTVSAASQSSSRGRRHVTIPKSPNFHSTHVPKSCIGKMGGGYDF